MSKLEIVGRSTQITHVWVKEASDELKWKNERRAFLALRAVLHALRDRLTIEEAVHLGAQLPTLIRGTYYDGWRPKKNPVRDSTRYGFLGEIQVAFAKTHDPQVDSIHRTALRGPKHVLARSSRIGPGKTFVQSGASVVR